MVNTPSPTTVKGMESVMVNMVDLAHKVCGIDKEPKHIHELADLLISLNIPYNQIPTIAKAICKEFELIKK